MFRAVIMMALVLGVVFFAQSTIDNDYFIINLSRGWQLLDTNKSCVWMPQSMGFVQYMVKDIKEKLGRLLYEKEFSCQQLVKYADNYELLVFTVKLKRELKEEFFAELLYTEDKSYEATALPAFEYSDLSLERGLGLLYIDPPVGLLYKFFILFPKNYHGALHVSIKSTMDRRYTLILASNKESLKELILIYEREIERLKKILEK